MILRLGYEVLPEIEKASTIDTHIDYNHSINSEEATA